jgi:serine/threonine-protein kinase
VSPEAAVGKRVDHRADIYGAGLVLHVMLTGKGPFDNIRDERRVLAAHVHDIPAPLSTHEVQGLTSELQAIISHALAKNPDERLGTAKELEERLARVLEQTTASSLQTTAPIAPPSGARARETPGIPVGALSPRVTSSPPASTQERASGAPAPAPVPIPPWAGPETPAPVASQTAARNPISIAAIFLGVALLVGLAAAGAVIVLRRFAGGDW